MGGEHARRDGGLAPIALAAVALGVLTERELLHALLTGKAPANRRPHLRVLLEESPRPLLTGLIRQVSRGSAPGKVERNLRKLAAAVGLPEGSGKWLTTND